MRDEIREHDRYVGRKQARRNRRNRAIVGWTLILMLSFVAGGILALAGILNVMIDAAVIFAFPVVAVAAATLVRR